MELGKKIIVNMKLFYMNFKSIRNLLDFFFSFCCFPNTIYIYIYFAEFRYTIFEHLGACFTNLLNTKSILNMNIEDNCTDTLIKLIKEKSIPSIWKVSTFIIPYSAYWNYNLVPIFLFFFNIEFIIWYGLLVMPENCTISISYINISKQEPINSLKLLLE